jgi:hypothetical protein
MYNVNTAITPTSEPLVDLIDVTIGQDSNRDIKKAQHLTIAQGLTG